MRIAVELDFKVKLTDSSGQEKSEVGRIVIDSETVLTNDELKENKHSIITGIPKCLEQELEAVYVRILKGLN